MMEHFWNGSKLWQFMESPFSKILRRMMTKFTCLPTAWHLHEKLISVNISSLKPRTKPALLLTHRQLFIFTQTFLITVSQSISIRYHFLNALNSLDHMPSVNLLHCLVQSKSLGGQNLVTDGFYVAEMMRRNYPAYFKTLSTVNVNWCDIGKEAGSSYHYLLRAPVIW